MYTQLAKVLTTLNTNAIRMLIKGGSGSGNFNHSGIPGQVGGSGPGGGTAYISSAFASAPIGKSSSAEAKAWRKENQEKYDTDRDFKTVADTVTLYTQGNYNSIRAFSEYAATEQLSEEYSNSIYSKHIEDNFSMSAMKSPMADSKSFFEGQKFDSESLSTISSLEASALLQSAISDSSPLDYPIYRGGQGWTDADRIPEVGEEFDIVGTSSFTADKDTADSFAEGRAKGQNIKIDRARFAATYKIKAGARGLNASALSPYDQKEIITSGKFKVTSVTKTKDAWNARRTVSIPKYEIELEHTATWKIDVAKFRNKKITTSYKRV